MLSVHTYPTIEAGVSGIRTAGLVALVPSRAGAHSCGLQTHRHQTRRSTVHHHWRVSNIENIGAATGPSTAGTRTFVYTDLKDDDLQERLELKVKGKDRKSQRQPKSNEFSTVVTQSLSRIIWNCKEKYRHLILHLTMRTSQTFSY